ncbi:siderophore-interacting protein [Jonesia quinghaiensis]|uniref:siderophore-interacting protein n=1 Tax=Jonesia quinghaiensis TaxID=262806 RepID=UPI0004203948|nr:siderophore-interacting protein [Jonesia quinghaiensis]
MTVTMPRERTACPAYRPYHATVRTVTMLSPHFIRVTFESPDFDVFGTARLDQRVKLLFPNAAGELNSLLLGGTEEDFLTWYQTWRALPDAERCPMRTYTVRSIDPQANTVDVDFAIHGATGPGSSWALNAKPGDSLVLVGPDDRSIDYRSGLDWRPGSACRYLLAGDETALPAIAAILESLPFETKADVFLEVPTTEDHLPLTSLADVTVTYVTRDAQPHGEALCAAVHTWAQRNSTLLAANASAIPQELRDIDIDSEMLWESPEALEGNYFYAWLAGESAAVKTMRRTLVQQHGLDRKKVAFMGYWRQGMSERQG